MILGYFGYLQYQRFKELKEALKEVQNLVNQDRLQPLNGHEFKTLAQGRKATPHMKPNASMAKPEIAEGEANTKEFGIEGPESNDSPMQNLVTDMDSIHNRDQLDLPVEGIQLAPTDVVEEMPKFPGGIGALMKWLDARIEYRPGFIRDKLEGDMEVTFIVQKDGSVEDIKVTKPINPTIDKMIIEILKEMPQWEAGKSNGRLTSVQIKLPIEFRLK